MAYVERLSPWCIIRQLPNMQQITVARFRRRNDAQDHMQVLRRLILGVTFTIIFDPALKQQETGFLNCKSRCSTDNSNWLSSRF